MVSQKTESNFNMILRVRSGFELSNDITCVWHREEMSKTVQFKWKIVVKIAFFHLRELN